MQHKKARVNGLFFASKFRYFSVFSQLNFLKSPAGRFTIQHKSVQAWAGPTLKKCAIWTIDIQSSHILRHDYQRSNVPIPLDTTGFSSPSH